MADLSAVVAKRESIRLNLDPNVAADQAAMADADAKARLDTEAMHTVDTPLNRALGRHATPGEEELAGSLMAGQERADARVAAERDAATPPTRPAPTNAQSTSEQVRDVAAGVPRRTPTLPGSELAGDIRARTTERIREGVEGGLFGEDTNAILEGLSTLSTASGSAVREIAKRIGISDENAGKLEMIATLAAAGLGMRADMGPKVLGLLAGTGKKAASLKSLDLKGVSGEIARLTQETGGATFNLGEGRNMAGESKFAVSIAPEAGQILEGLAAPEQVAAFIKRNRDRLELPGANVGTWVNEGKTHVDISILADTLEEALGIGRQFRQKAVFDLANFTEIPVPVPNTVGHYVAPTMPLREVDTRVATAYDALPEFDAAAVPAWDALAVEVNKKFDELTATGLRIERVTGQPYASAEEMAADIRQGVLKVTTDNSEHPLWDVDTNWKFRAWHDYVHHYLHGNDFSLDGEWRAYQVASNAVADPLARRALMTEIYGQAASAVANGGVFPPQKVALFDDVTEAAAKLPDMADRVPHGRSRVEQALLAGRWTPVAAIGAAAAGDAALAGMTPDDPNAPAQAAVAAPLLTIAATVLAGKKLSTIQKNALVNQAAGLIWRGVKEQEFRRVAQQQYGVGIARELDGVFEKGQKQFEKILSGLKPRARADIERFFRIGMDKSGEWRGGDWYGLGDELVDMFGDDAELVAKLIAATSPQTAVQSVGGKKGNVELALDAYEMLKKGATREEILNTFDMSHGPNIMRAWNGEELSGNKVQDFHKAIYVKALGRGDDQRAVIDSHMIGALVDPESKRLTLPSKTGRPQREIFITETKDMSDAEYAALSEFVSDFARVHGVSPRQAQQAIWIGRKLEEGREVAEEIIEPLHATVRRMWEKAGVEKEAFDFFDSKRSLVFAAAAIGIAAVNHGMGDAEAAVDEWAQGVGLASLINPRAAKALASVVRMMSRVKPSVEVGHATLNIADRLRRLDSSTITVGKKLLSIDWSTLGHSPDNLRATLQKIKEVYDVEGVHSVSRGVVSDADEAALAKYLREELGFDAEEVLKRQAGEGVNSSWVWATADVLRAGLRRLDELDKAVDAAAGTPGEVVALIDYAEHAELVGALAKALDGGAEEAGRALRAFQAAKDVTDAPKLSFLRERAYRVRQGIEPNFLPKPDAPAPGPLADVKQAPPDQVPGPEATNVPPGLARLIDQGREIPKPGGEFPAPSGPGPRSEFMGRGEATSPGKFNHPLAAGQGEDPAAAVQRAKGAKTPLSTDVGDMTTGGASAPRGASSPLAQLRSLASQAQKFGPEAGPGNTSAYQAMLKQPQVAELVMSAQRLREMLKELPPAQKPSFIKAALSWGWDMLWEVFYDSLLKTIPGNAANLTFNTLNTGRMVAVRYMSALEPGSRYSFAHANAYAGALVESMTEAFRMAGKTFWEGQSAFAQEQKMGGIVRALSGARMQQFAQQAGMIDQGMDLSEPWKMFWNAMGVALTTGTRGMMSGDEAFRTLGFRAALAEQAIDAAFKTGHEYGTPAFIAAYKAAKANPDDAAVRIAKEHAAYLTLTNSLGGSVGGLATFLRNPLVRPFVPFFSVTANLTAQNIEQLSGFNALALLQGKIRTDVLSGGPAGAIATHKMALGAGLLLTGWYLYHNGQLTGRMPGEPGVRKHLQDQKIEPNSFVHVDSKGNRTYIPLERMDGVAGPMLMIADVLDVYYGYAGEDGAPLLSAEWLQAASAAIVLGMWHNIMDKPWMSSTKQFFDAISMDQARDAEQMVKVLQNTGLAFATWPTGRAGAQIERARYPIIPEAQEFIDRLYSQLPWGTVSYDPKTGEQRKNPFAWLGGRERTLYPRHKASGEPMIGTPWEGAMALTPWRAKGMEPDEASKMLFNNEVRVPRVPRTFAGAADTLMERPGTRVHGPLIEPKHRARIERLRGNGLKLPANDWAPLVRAFGYQGELPDKKMGMWDVLTVLADSKDFRSLQGGPGSIQQQILQGIVHSFHTAAIRTVMMEDEKLAEQFVDYQGDRTEQLLGPDGRAMIQPSLDAAKREMRSQRPTINRFIEGLTR